jgi:hypothetical protein
MRNSLFALASLSAACATPVFAQSETSLLAVDAQQLAAGQAGDVDALGKLMLPNFIINSPSGDSGSGARTLQRFRTGEVAHESFVRIIERVAITDNVGIVMGREIARLAPTSIDGKARGGNASPVIRRFTNIYLWKDGKWGWLARHAAYRPEPVSAEDLAREAELKKPPK